MFCPKCAAHNIDDAKYCRVCGADISLLPQVLSGQLNADVMVVDETAIEEKGKRRKRKDKDKPPTLEKAYESLGVGLAFLIISVMVALFMPGGRFWWFWMLIPALACLGEGIGLLMRLRREKAPQGSHEPLLPESREAYLNNLPPRNTSEILMPPPSITEGTTRHLNPEPLAKSLDEQAEQPPKRI